MTTKDQRIEAALAFGRSDDWIKQHLGASEREIAKVRAHWAELLSVDPWFQQYSAGVR